MISVLLDHNIRGFLILLQGTVDAKRSSNPELIKFIQLEDVGLSMDSPDDEIWRLVQRHQILLLTNNRNSKGVDSLQQTIEREGTFESLPILTFGNIDRLSEKTYRERCIARIFEIATNISNYRGCGRLFIP
ncbi:MAG: hypothetical protein B6244_12380 [Candidatus Cloacimonetes bacterium 4572_55]|nr:MAG: hypothetical protein B6244_12380 [Candidatus Cloacimonetes bacterium 4572_55]